ncbi:MAG: ECF transporter S component [Clostridia bacterium]|nr:ECF transporter S component [Clostridia bacterium]
MNKHFSTRSFVILALLIGLLLLMSTTPLGYMNIGPLAITFNVIPVAIAAIALGPVGGAICGAVFGLTSFLQCIGIGGMSAMGAALFAIQPFYAFVQRFVPRVLDGFLLGYIFRATNRRAPSSVACMVTGFCSAFLNTLLFMAALILLFGGTEYVQNLAGGRNWIVFVCTFVGVNAVAEMVSSTVLTGAIGAALIKAGLIHAEK